MNRWPFPDFPSFEHVCTCGHHMLKPKDGESYCFNVMCEKGKKAHEAWEVKNNQEKSLGWR